MSTSTLWAFPYTSQAHLCPLNGSFQALALLAHPITGVGGGRYLPLTSRTQTHTLKHTRVRTHVSTSSVYPIQAHQRLGHSSNLTRTHTPARTRSNFYEPLSGPKSARAPTARTNWLPREECAVGDLQVAAVQIEGKNKKNKNE